MDALIAEGRLEQLEVDDGGPPVLAVPGHEPDGGGAAVLLSPFDNLLWDRPFAERALGFRHLIEVYKRPHERVYGYYVLPFLHGTRIAARCDLKTDRGRAGAAPGGAAPRDRGALGRGPAGGAGAGAGAAGVAGRRRTGRAR